MPFGGNEVEPGQGSAGEPEQISETDSQSLERWEQSIWAGHIELFLAEAEEFGHKPLAEWSNWMIEGGFRLPDKDIAAKAEEIIGLDEKRLLRRIQEMKFLKEGYKEEQAYRKAWQDDNESH